ncbi:MAG: hypothetical protein EOM24_15285, partial [Chloroflexia bacterium]|nr:hypothetical protein [Chloroflexia bacterium]
MFHLPTFRHFIRLLTLIVFTLGLASVNPLASVDAHVPAAPSAPAAFAVADAGETNSTAPSALTEAVQAAVTRFLGQQPTSSVIVEDIRYDAGWAAGSVLIMASEDRPAPTAWVFLARQEATRWSVALEPEAQFQTWLAEVPASVMSEEVQALFRIAPSLAGNGAAQLSLPWATGETWYFTGGPHVGGFVTQQLWSAIDFSAGTGSGNIRAAREGVAYTYATCPNFIRVVHSDGWRTTYYHVAQSSISVSNGQTIQRGTYLGKTSAEYGCGGYAIGPHVHFSLELNGQGVAFHGIDVGGWTVASGGAEYKGTMTRIRDGAVRSASIYLTANNSIYNDGTIGSGTPPEMAIDNPGNGVSVNRDIVISGWAMHRAAASGTGVDTIHIYFDGPAGSGAHGVAATYGTRRDDLAAAYGERFRYAGFEFVINSAQLSLGQHTLYVYARSTVTGEWQLQTRTFTVANIPPNVPTHATPANGATLTGPTVTFTWNDPGDPDNRPRDYRDYVLQVINSAGTVVAEMPWAATTRWQTNLADGAYTWRLHAGDGAEGSGWSSNWSFTVRSRYTISGQVTAANGAGLAGVTLSDGTRNATTNAEGAYTLNDVPPGTYTLTPTKEGYRFEPATRNVTVNGNVTGQD